MMEIQSLSVCVPAKCPNKCKFCVSRMHENDYERRVYSDDPYADGDFIDRLEYARDNGVQCLIFTGTGEPLLNMPFINYFGSINRKLSSKFRHIEIQTSGVTLDDEKLSDLKTAGVKTISLSISSFNSKQNMDFNGTPKKLKVDISKTCERIKDYNFNLRLSLNMTKAFDMAPVGIFSAAKVLEADQVTFRVLYNSGLDLPQDKWIMENKASNETIHNINGFVKSQGNPLYRLSFGAMKYDVLGMSVVIDDDCMNTDVKNVLKYFILREDCRLYSHWDKKGSLIY